MNTTTLKKSCKEWVELKVIFPRLLSGERENQIKKVSLNGFNQFKDATTLKEGEQINIFGGVYEFIRIEKNKRLITHQILKDYFNHKVSQNNFNKKWNLNYNEQIIIMNLINNLSDTFNKLNKERL